MTDFTLRPLTVPERKYTYAQSSQLQGQTGNIGYLRGDFGSSGDQFYTTYNARLYEKMKAEQDKYRDWLASQEPSEILNHTYRYHAECCRSVAELHSNHNACKL